MNNQDPVNWLDEYGDYLYAVALRQTGNATVAEDIVQDTLIAAWQGFEGFKGESSIKTWLTAILKNKVLDYLRRAFHREIPTIFEEPSSTQDDDFNSWGIWKNKVAKWAVWPETPEDSVSRQQLYDVLKSCLEKLPKVQRAVMMMKFLEERESETICSALNITASNLWILVFRARLKLRSCLDMNWYKKESLK